MRYLILSAIIAFSQFATAQNYLTHTVQEADELLGRPRKEVYSFDKLSIFDDGTTPTFQFFCGEHIFDTGFFIVGIYNNEDKLLTKTIDRGWFAFSSENKQYCNMYKSCNFITHIEGLTEDEECDCYGVKCYRLTSKSLLNYLLDGDGYVRFHTTLYGGYPYDIVVHCNNYKQPKEK